MMDETLAAGRLAWNINRRTLDRDARAPLGAVDPAPMLRRDLPFGIVRRRGDDAHIVAKSCQCFTKLGIVFCDPDQIGSVIDAANEDTHDPAPRRIGSVLAWSKGIVRLTLASSDSVT